MTSTFRERSSVFFSDSSGSGLTGNGILDTIGTRGQTERGIQSALNPVDAASSFKVLGRSGSDKPSISAKPRDEFRELLGLEKPEAPLPKQQVIGGLGDNINTNPDLTKREINPVTPRPTVGGGGSSLPFFQESQITAVQRNPLKPPELEVLPGKAFVPAAGESSLAPVTDLRKRMMSPTVLPIPKRNF
ncbi:MAG: hypothetical protein N3G20_00925 [Verrucomicrobiae bacterium]|nr:hypothetical protein [Verrucomicrobiae bacterium]